MCHLERAVDVFISLAFVQRPRRQLAASTDGPPGSPGCAYGLEGVRSATLIHILGQWRTQEFCSGGGGVQQIQLRTERTGIWGR